MGNSLVIPFLMLGSLVIFFAFILTFQQIHFLKKDILKLEKENNEMSRTLRAESYKIKDLEWEIKRLKEK